MMRTLLILAAIIGFSASALAQTAAPKVSGKPLKQTRPSAQFDGAARRALTGDYQTLT